MQMSAIYVLKGHDKYYIGRTQDIVRRFNEHKSGRGAKWCKVWPMTGMIELVPETFEFQELVTTLKYMKAYGIDNVRGGPWCKVVLSQDDIVTIQDILDSESFARGPADGGKTTEAPRPDVGPPAGLPDADMADGPRGFQADDGHDAAADEPAGSNRGKRWTQYDEWSIFQDFRNKVPIEAVAQRLGRTVGAIKSRVSHVVRSKLDTGVAIPIIMDETNLVRSDIDLCAMRQRPILNAYWK